MPGELDESGNEEKRLAAISKVGEARRWHHLLEKHGLTGQHFQWFRKERERMERDRERRTRTLAASGDGGTTSGGIQNSPKFASPRPIKALISSLVVAKERLSYLSPGWQSGLAADEYYEAGADRLNVLKVEVLDEVRKLWMGHTEEIDRWYEEVCVPAVEKALSDEITALLRRAHDEELRACDEELRLLETLQHSDDDGSAGSPVSVQAESEQPSEVPSADPAQVPKERKSLTGLMDKRANAETRERRYAFLKQYREDNRIGTMGDLARRFALSVTAIQGIVRGDRTRYSEEKLATFLKGIGVTPSEW